MVRTIGIIVVVVVIIFFAIDAIVTILARPNLGRKACEQYKIPYRAVIAHRGASYWAPEETYYAYEIAKRVGVEYLEIDVQRTKDDVLIAFHDDDLSRITNVAEVFPGREKDPINTFTIAQLKQLTVGEWFNKNFPDRAKESYKDARILTLDEVIDIAKSHESLYPLYIETKNARLFPGIEKQLVELLQSRGYINPQTMTAAHTISPLIFQSFEIESLLLLKKYAPTVPRVYLIDEKMVADKGWEKLLNEAKEAECAGIGPSGYLGWPWNIGRIHRHGLIVHVYTINKTWQYRLLHWFGADGFFTDRCELLMEFYRKPMKQPLQEVLRSIK